MRKFTKLASASFLGVGLFELIKNFKQIKSNLTKDRQLTNRLIEQVKDSRKSLSNVANSLNEVDLSKVSHHMKSFNQELKPHLSQIQADLQKIKKNH